MLLGDAVHTAHFSVGSGTKMAMEDAMALSRALTENPDDVTAALAAYEESAQPSVRKIQDSARPSLSWWEHFGQYYDVFEPWQFAYHFLSRSITDTRLARRAPGFVETTHRSWVAEHGAEPLDTPFSAGGWSTAGRLVDVEFADGVPTQVGKVPLSPVPRSGSWGLAIAAPDSETELPAVYEKLTAIGYPALVAVHGGTPLTRVLVCERARMVEKIPALLVDPGIDRDQALTTVLSGRADLIGGVA